MVKLLNKTRTRIRAWKGRQETGMQRPAHKGEHGKVCLILFHPDYDRRLRHLTGSADPDPAISQVERSRAPRVNRDTAGGELHPALRISADSLKKNGCRYQPKYPAG
ncbi:hypothetical protein AO721_02140 [Aeromonas veronii]|nr:hypothetical protein AO728_01955 [Aeromonas veronii]KRV79163.1 hypothetical protein AO719_01955 [Aeromonas veronii]KRV90767.1 hypothetical protein AO721_02140 [Aeromonas veronii]